MTFSVNIDLKGAKNIHIFKVLFWTLENAGGSWLCLVYYPWFRYCLQAVINLYYEFWWSLWFRRCKEHTCSLSQDWGIGWYCSFLLGFGIFYHTLDIITSISWTHVLNLSFLYWFSSCKENQSCWCPDFCFRGHCRFSILIIIWIFSPVFDIFLFWIFSVYIDLDDAKTSMSFRF